MSKHRTMLKAIRYCGISILSIGIILFTIGFLESGSSILTPIGIGTVMGAIFIFLMGVFFVATEETLEKSEKTPRGFLFKR
ncbi:hypothetical protein ACQCT6_07915 [Cytobacillus gottheilii]|uniref:Uncharacterized protein n=2 Tax=Bacillaceae TaxID=186817 RepID=A0A7V7UVW4_9BACI|nr:MULTISPECIES: hypothetical protein [Bacillaceae]KAB2329848.1 hypothetical protein F7732_20390 [Bacillus mesophilum]QVY59889.1 hypothetical protein J1899_12575 [Cytobacillus gottheilii]